MNMMNSLIARLPPPWPEFWRLARLDRPIGILLLLWPTLWGLWIASHGHPSLHLVFVFVGGTVLMRSAGCVINDYADRHFDGHVERTRHRPLAVGSVKPRQALILALCLSLLAFALVLSCNTLTILLSFPAIALAASYPFSKRFFPLPQAWLGIAFGFGIPMAFAASQGKVPNVAWVLCLANMFWSIAYDTEYAMVDRPDDLKLGIHTAAIFFGRFDIAAIMLCYGLALVLLFLAGQMVALGSFWYGGLFLAAIITLYHGRLIQHRDRDLCFKAFLHNNWWGAVIFAGLCLDLAAFSA
jgi:4-hydroxybenzoate polyprenyltransferase